MINPRRSHVVALHVSEPPEIRIGHIYRLRDRDGRWLAWDYIEQAVRFVAIGSPFELNVEDMGLIESLSFTMHTSYAQDVWDRVSAAKGVAA